MKIKLLVLVSFVAIAINLNGQSASKYFKYEKNEYGSTVITPLEEVNVILKKGQASLYSPSGYTPTWHQDCRIKPFQELIDSGVFSKERMRELAN